MFSWKRKSKLIKLQDSYLHVEQQTPLRGCGEQEGGWQPSILIQLQFRSMWREQMRGSDFSLPSPLFKHKNFFWLLAKDTVSRVLLCRTPLSG